MNPETRFIHAAFRGRQVVQVGPVPKQKNILQIRCKQYTDYI